MGEPQLVDQVVERTELKYQHALDLFTDLDSMVADWNSLDQVTMAPVLTNARRIEYRMRVLSEPPIDEWSLTFADAVHNLRSALDTLAWEVANLVPDRPPKRPKDIYFPTAKDDVEWARWEKRLTDIPPVYLGRMNLTRTILAADGKPFAEVLNQLDIDDKHRGLLQSGAGVDISAYNLRLGPPPGVTTITGTLTPILTPKVIPIEEDSLLGGYESDVDVRLLNDEPSKVNITASLDIGDKHIRVPQFSETAAAAIRFSIDLVRYGRDEAVRMAIDSGLAASIGSV